MTVRPLLLAAVLLAAPVTARADPTEVVVDVHGAGIAVRGHVHRDCCRYERGRYETRAVRVVLPGHHVERVIPARFAIRWSPRRCAYVRVLVSPRRVVREWVPERVRVERRRVWVGGGWRCR